MSYNTHHELKSDSYENSVTKRKHATPD